MCQTIRCGQSTVFVEGKQWKTKQKRERKREGIEREKVPELPKFG